MVGATTVQAGAVTREADFDAFYRRERSGLFRALALTLADRDLAAEAVDEGMARAYQHWQRLAGYDNPAGWVYRVGLNWAIGRRRRIRRGLPLRTEPTAVGEPDLGDPQLAAAVASLPTRQRAVVVLRFDLDWSLDHIAAALNVPTGTVKSRLNRALTALRESLGDDHDA